jgi:HK97 family phage portal protein
MRLPAFLKRETLTREAPSIDAQVSAFWDSLRGGGFSPRLIDKVWAANRCIQLNAQQIAAMPLRFYGNYEPAWVSNPDPTWFPNGITDAIFAVIRSMYGWGDAFLLVTDRYASGFPSAWTVLNPEPISVRTLNGRRDYRSGNKPLNPDDVVQISRNPSAGMRGTSALQASSSHMLSAIASSDLSRTINEGGIPNAVLKSTTRKLTEEQAIKLQDQWVARATVRRGAPAVLPPEIEFEQLAFSPKDLLLLDAQEFDARVIGAAFGVPPFLLNMPLTGGLTYQSPEMLLETWARTELVPVGVRVSQSLSANMLPRGSWVEFDESRLLAPAWGDLVESWEKIIGFGGASAAEFRASVLRLPPQSEQESIQDELVPPVAATSGQTGDNSVVVPLRPTQEVGG